MNTLTNKEKQSISSFIKNLSGNTGAQMTEDDKKEMGKIQEDGYNEGEAFYQLFIQ